MKQDAPTACLNLPELSREEKREIFIKRRGWTLRYLARIAGVSASTLSRSMRNQTMPTEQHQALVKAGIPEELLPAPLDIPPGPKPKNPQPDADARP